MAEETTTNEQTNMNTTNETSGNIDTYY